MKYLARDDYVGADKPPKGVCRDIKLLVGHVEKMERAYNTAMNLIRKEDLRRKESTK